MQFLKYIYSNDIPYIHPYVYFNTCSLKAIFIISLRTFRYTYTASVQLHGYNVIEFLHIHTHLSRTCKILYVMLSQIVIIMQQYLCAYLQGIKMVGFVSTEKAVALAATALSSPRFI